MVSLDAYLRHLSHLKLIQEMCNAFTLSNVSLISCPMANFLKHYSYDVDAWLFGHTKVHSRIALGN